jgi:hypothetical protein
VRLTLFLCAAAALGQAQSPPPSAGLEPSWDVAVILEEIGKNASALVPALGRFDANSWVAKGASDTYVTQLQSSRDQARAIADDARALAKNPERLAPALELFFRLEGLERMMLSVEDAARRYQSPQVAQNLASVYAEQGANRERFRRYIVNLAAERERQFNVMDKEAQRCRATLMASPPANTTPPKTTGRKK